MSGRTLRILGRFPAHLEATRQGKQLGAVTEALARDLDELSTDLGAVRRAHQLAHAESLPDVRRLGGLHGIGANDTSLFSVRAERIRELSGRLRARAEDAATDAEALLDLWGVDLPKPRLHLFAPLPESGSPMDLGAALDRLVAAADDYLALVDLARARVGRIASIHAAGNGTVRALLEGAANALDLDLDVAKNLAAKELLRPRVSASVVGSAGARSYAYVVVARERDNYCLRRSAPAATRRGPAKLSAQGFVRLSWAPIDGAADYLVFRVMSGGEPAETGLLTPVPLPPGTVSFDDDGLAATAVPVPFDSTEDIYHSRDRFWHASFVANRSTLSRSVEAPSPDKVVRMARALGVGELSRVVGADEAEVRERLATLLADQGLADADADALPPELVEMLAAGYGFEVELMQRGTISMGRAITLAELAKKLGVRIERLLRRAESAGMAEPKATTEIDADAAARIARGLGFAVTQVLPVKEEVLGIEEHPLVERDAEGNRVDAELFHILRRGFSRESLEVRIRGIEERTIGPMLVNRDEGHGIGFAGIGGDGKTLVFGDDGRARIGDIDVTEYAYAWKGACFAASDDDPAKPRDFVFDGPGVDPVRRAVFAVATPADALDRDAVFPHSGVDLPMPGISLGKTRFAFFVQEAHLSDRIDAPAPEVRRVTPHPRIGFATGGDFHLGSVFARFSKGLRPYGAAITAAVLAAFQAEKAEAPAAHVALRWREHDAYVVRVLIPRRLALLDTEVSKATERVRAALERFRPAGINLRVEYIDDAWILGEGVLPGGAGRDPIALLRGGTVV